MKKIINFKRFLTALVCCCLLISGFSFGAAATDNANTPTIDDEATGKLTLEKYENTADGTFVNKGKPVTGATFTAYKVSEVSSQGVTSLIYKNGVDGEKIDFTSTTSVNSALITLVQNSHQKTYVSTESSKGIYTFGDIVDGEKVMELGIYLVVETVSPKNYYATTDAFLVSIPQTNSDGDSWEYDVIAYPKNKPINVEKFVTGDDIKADSYSIGDVVPFIVKSTIPEYSAKTYVNTDTLEYYFIDTMSDGLTFDNTSVEVYVDVDDKLDATEYTVETENIEDATVKISLTSDAIREYAGKSITVKYSATLNENARITTGEMNSVTLTFITNPQTGENHKTDPEITKVYTYKMILDKEFENGAPNDAIMSDVMFTLTFKDKVEGKVVDKILYATNKDEAWIVNSKVSVEGINPEDKNDYTKNLSLNAEGKLIIKGLEAGEYTLTEVSTLPGYNLLKAPITIVVEETTNPTTKVVTGNVKATIEGFEVANNGGSFTFTVNNTKGFKLPQTGGMGTWMYTLGGLLLMAASAVVMLSMRKRRAVK